MFMASMVVPTSAKDRIAIVEEKAWRIMRRKSIAELLCGPGRSRMGGDRYVHDSSTVVREDDQSNNNRNVTVGTIGPKFGDIFRTSDICATVSLDTKYRRFRPRLVKTTCRRTMASPRADLSPRTPAAAGAAARSAQCRRG